MVQRYPCRIQKLNKGEWGLSWPFYIFFLTHKEKDSLNFSCLRLSGIKGNTVP